jgi:hypothetical protein
VEKNAAAGAQWSLPRKTTGNCHAQCTRCTPTPKTYQTCGGERGAYALEGKVAGTCFLRACNPNSLLSLRHFSSFSWFITTDA